MQFPDRPKSEASGHFLKLKNGESIVGMFRGDPVRFEQHFLNQKGFLCTATTHCQSCLDGDFPKFRFRLNFITVIDGTPCAKIFEQGGVVYDALSTLARDGYHLDEHFVRITRTGERQQTKYTITPLPNGKATPAQMASINAVQLHDLNPYGKKDDTAQANGWHPPDDSYTPPANDDIPF